MRGRGLAIGAVLVALVVLTLTFGAQAARAAEPQPAKKAAPAKKSTGAAQARPKKPAAANNPAPSRSRSTSRANPAVAAVPALTAAPLPAAAPQPAAASEPAAIVPPATVATPSSPLPAAEPPSLAPTPIEIPQPAVEVPEPLVPVTPAAPQKISLAQAAVLGVVEGLTEYLPVSSTGHLILAGYWMGLTRETDEPGAFGGHKLEKVPAIDAFEIVIQLGAILAVIGLYRKRVTQMGKGLVGRSEQGLRLAILLFVAFIPAAVVGLALHEQIQEHLFGPMPVVIALAVGGVLMIVVERVFWTRRKARLHEATQTRSMMPIAAAGSTGTGPRVSVLAAPRTSPFTRVDTMLLWQAVAIGLAQCLSLWPGTSRSMVTILAALVVGLDLVAAAEFSFLLALPTLGAATVYSLAKHHEELMASAGVGGLLVGLLVSGIVAALAVHWFVRYLTRHGLAPFGVYRIIIALVLMLYFLG
jgi:undecaprenyl-diphosphatase